MLTENAVVKEVAKKLNATPCTGFNCVERSPGPLCYPEVCAGELVQFVDHKRNELTY
jgi:hypothetical protein